MGPDNSIRSRPLWPLVPALLTGLVLFWPLERLNSRHETSLLALFAANEIQTAVRSGTMAFRYRDEGQGSLWQSVDYLNGSLSRIADWQKTGKIYEFLAAQAGLNSQPLAVPGELAEDTRFSELKFYRIAQTEKKRELICAHALRARHEADGSRILIDFCLLPAPGKVAQAVTNLNRLLVLFAQEERWPSAFGNSIAIFANDKDSLSPELPAFFFRVESRDSRSWFVDSAGLAEAEIFREPLSLLQSDDLALKMYDDSIAEVLAKQGNWSMQGDVLVSGKTRCLLFRNTETRLVSYCHMVITPRREKQLQRLTFLVIFPEELYHSDRLRKWQLEVMTTWQQNKP